MVSENNLIPVENKKPVEIVAELKETNWWEKYEVKRSKLSLGIKVNKRHGSDYVSENKEGYGPCKNSLCGCSCSSSTCVCASTERSFFSKGSDQWGSFAAAGRKEGWQEDLSGDASISLYRCKGGNDDAKILSASAGTNISRTSVNIRAGVNLLDYKSDGVRARVGLNADTGISTSDGVEAKFLGFGLSVGKKNGISTPFFSVSKDADDCVIQ